MTFNSNKYHRRSIRLKGFNYSSPGAYFITICTQNREYLFGEIVNGKIIMNDAGQMVQTVWDDIARYCASLQNHDDKTIYGWYQIPGMDTIPR